MSKLFFLYRTLVKLGLHNIAYVAWYRLTLKTSIRKRWFPLEELPNDRGFFIPSTPHSEYPQEWKEPLLVDADAIINGQFRYYAYHWKTIGSPPNWFRNPFSGQIYPNHDRHWTKLPDFHPEVGDIKNVWEASRFEWLVNLARAYAVTADDRYLNTINNWLADWCRANPLNTGPNWKCGQEASIRVFNLMNAACILSQWNKPSKAISDLIFVHLKRISGNILYAIAQNNNHGTSEAAALFVGGNWLMASGSNNYPEARNYAVSGRKWMENRVNRLIANDGSFSQHSTNYHRVVLDTLSFTEHWRRTLQLRPFSEKFYRKARAATQWLWHLTDETSYDTPNIGANDGAMFLHTHTCDFRDFRPSNQLAQALFFNRLLYSAGPWDEPLYWYNISRDHLPLIELARESVVLDNAYVVMKDQDSWALLRLPRFKFRPSHNDVFHLDLWHKGKNVLCDSGSYSYNPGKESTIDFKSVHAHNTASFDDHEQMPSLGRFLLGKWIVPETIETLTADENNGSWSGSYKDYCGNLHYRSVRWENQTWIVEDRFSGPFKAARIGFNLSAGEYEMVGHNLNAPWGQVHIEGASKLFLQPCFSSKYYWHKEQGDRLVAEANSENRIITTIVLKA